MKDASQLFADNGVSKALSKRIIDVLHSKDMDGTSFDRILFRMMQFLKETSLRQMMNKMPKEQIETIVDELVEDMQPDHNSAPFSENDTLWLFSELAFSDQKTFSAGDVVDIQIMRVGEWSHPIYGKVSVGKDTIRDVVKNFNSDQRGIKLAIDENHEPNHKALGWIEKLYTKGKENLFATIELTTKGADLLTEGAYKYFSPEIVFNKTDEESGKSIKNLLTGGAFTNRPFFKSMEALMASEAAMSEKDNNGKPDISNNVILFNQNKMKKIFDMIAKFSEMETINAEDKDALATCFNELDDSERDMSRIAVDAQLGKFSEDDADEEPQEEVAVDEAPEKEAEEVVASEDNSEEVSDEADEEVKEEVVADEIEAAEPKEEEEETIEEVVADEVVATEEVKSSEFSELQAKFNEQATEIATFKKAEKKASIDAQFSEFAFSENNKEGFMVPKDVKKFSSLISELSDKQAGEFLKAFSQMEPIVGGVAGHSHDAVSEFSASDVEFNMSHLGMDKEKAIEAAKDKASRK